MPYESGIVPTGDARQRFSVKFYLVAMLFILFDIEAIFFIPLGGGLSRTVDAGLYRNVDFCNFDPIRVFLHLEKRRTGLVRGGFQAKIVADNSKMLSDTLRQNAIATAVEAFDADAITGGTFDRGELTLEIAPGKILSICGFLKYDQKFVRLSSVTAVDRYPSEPRFEVVYHLHSIRAEPTRATEMSRLRRRSGYRIGHFRMARRQLVRA